MPMMSTVSPVWTTPRSIRPVTTVPRPVIENTSSTGIRNGFSTSRTGSGIASSTAFMSSRTDSPHFSSPFSAGYGRNADDRDVVARELVLGEQLADLELDELEDLLVVHHVALVERDDDVRHADLTGEQHVLAGLRHRAVGGGDHEDRAVHLRGTGDHVLHVVRVTRAVNVRVVPLLGLVLDVRDRDRDAALLSSFALSIWSNGVEGVDIRVLVVQHLGDRRGQGRLAVVDVPDGADVDVRLSPLELCLRHWYLLVAIRPTRGGSGVFLGSYCLLLRTARTDCYSPRALAMISLAMFGGTSAYESNCML